jgi:hypothetical protein
LPTTLEEHPSLTIPAIAHRHYLLLLLLLLLLLK